MSTWRIGVWVVAPVIAPVIAGVIAGVIADPPAYDGF
jgi:hypothetical protein